MNWMEKYGDYLSSAKRMIEAGDELHAAVLELRRNPANVDDLIHSGYLTAKSEAAYEEAERLLSLSENALRERAQELGVEVTL